MVLVVVIATRDLFIAAYCSRFVFILEEWIVLHLKLEQCSRNDEKEKHTTTDGKRTDGYRTQNMPRTYRQRDNGRI